MHAQFKPVEGTARYVVLDLVRGFALFGILLVNLLYFFRVSLFDHILRPHSHPGWANNAIDDFVARWIEFKAFDLFSLTFGIGVAVQAANGGAFLARRFAILLAFGLAHLTLVSNVDILTLYAVCGFVLIPLLRLPAPVLASVGVAAVFGPTLLPVPALPDLQAHAAEATRIYSQGSFALMLHFRWHETLRFILPLLIAVAQKTLGLMMVGIAVWRSGVIQNPEPYRRLLWAICAVAATAGLTLREHVPLAAAYGTALLAWRRSERAKRWTAPIAAAGRMAFTNYLTQSLVFALVFNGFGWFGRVSPVAAAAGGIVFYAMQVWWSAWWLARHRFGPFEWIWRSLTYGRRQPWRGVIFATARAHCGSAR